MQTTPAPLCSALQTVRPGGELGVGAVTSLLGTCQAACHTARAWARSGSCRDNLVTWLLLMPAGSQP